MSRLGRLAQYGALVLFGLLVGFGLLEVALRLMGTGKPAELGPEFDRPEVFFLPERGRQHPWAQGAEEVLRLATIGDSFTVGEANLWDDAYPSRLERLLNLNEGVTPALVEVYANKGTATAQHVGYLRRAIADGTDVVVLGITLNDPEGPGDPRIRQWRDEMMPRPASGWKGGALRASRTAGLVYQRLETLRARRAQRGYVEYLYDPEYAGWQQFAHSLKRFGRICRKRELPLLAVIFPTMSGLGPHYGMRFAHEQIADALEAEGIVYLDLLPAFEDKSDARMSAFAEIDAHPSEIAHRIAAMAIFEALLDEGMVDEAYRPKRAFIERDIETWLRLTRRMRSVLYP